MGRVRRPEQSSSAKPTDRQMPDDDLRRMKVAFGLLPVQQLDVLAMAEQPRRVANWIKTCISEGWSFPIELIAARNIALERGYDVKPGRAEKLPSPSQLFLAMAVARVMVDRRNGTLLKHALPDALSWLNNKSDKKISQSTLKNHYYRAMNQVKATYYRDDTGQMVRETMITLADLKPRKQ